MLHRVDRIEQAPHCAIIPKIHRLFYYKGAMRSIAEREHEESKTVKGIDGTTKQVDHVYSDPSQNAEANALGLFESVVV